MTKTALLELITEILKEYNNRESDIPLKHKYWDLLNQLRGM